MPWGFYMGQIEMCHADVNGRVFLLNNRLILLAYRLLFSYLQAKEEETRKYQEDMNKFLENLRQKHDKVRCFFSNFGL